METKVCITICTNRDIKPQTVQSLADMIAYTDTEVMTLIAREGYTIAENRNYSIFKALENNCTHILFIDDDMEFPSCTLDCLLFHKKEVVGVDSKSRKLPLSTTVGLMKDGKLWNPSEVPGFYKMPQDLFECWSIGFGVALIDLKVFDAIKKPWFSFEVHPSGMIMKGEDAWFCDQAREEGYKIWCDPTIEIGHIGEYNYADYYQPNEE